MVDLSRSWYVNVAGVTVDPSPSDPGLPEYLVRLVSSWGCGLLSCDYEDCFASEIDDLMAGGDELRPIYLDVRHDVRICRRCVEAGKHLEPEGTDA